MNIGRITVRMVGIQGPPGPRGEDLSVTHAQPEPATVWVIEHGLAYNPCVSVVDPHGDEVTAAVSHTVGATSIKFSEPMAGIARLT